MCVISRIRSFPVFLLGVQLRGTVVAALNMNTQLTNRHWTRGLYTYRQGQTGSRHKYSIYKERHMPYPRMKQRKVRERERKRQPNESKISKHISMEKHNAHRTIS